MKRMRNKKSYLQSPALVLQLLGHTIEQHTHPHRITIDGHLISFSRTEYSLMIVLLQHAQHLGDCASFGDLSHSFKHTPADLRRLLYRHMNKMRTKLWPFELDIINIRDRGYILTHKQVQAETESS